MAISERREREKEHVRQKIFEAARELLVRDGYDAVTMRQIAEQIEYSTGTLYLHFADKPSLIRALCAHDFYAFSTSFRGLEKRTDPLARLRRLGELYVEFALRHPQQYRMMFLARPPVGSNYDLAERGNPEQDAYAILEEAVGYALKAGLFPSFHDAPQLMAQTLWAGMHGVVALEIVLRESNNPLGLEEVHRRAATMLNVLMTGLQTSKLPDVPVARKRKR